MNKGKKKIATIKDILAEVKFAQKNPHEVTYHRCNECSKSWKAFMPTLNIEKINKQTMKELMLKNMKIKGLHKHKILLRKEEKTVGKI